MKRGNDEKNGGKMVNICFLFYYISTDPKITSWVEVRVLELLRVWQGGCLKMDKPSLFDFENYQLKYSRSKKKTLRLAGAGGTSGCVGLSTVPVMLRRAFLLPVSIYSSFCELVILLSHVNL